MYSDIKFYGYDHKYQVGQLVNYRSNFGSGPIETATIESNEDTKNDRPVYDLSNGHWCYEDAIIRVIE